MTGGIEEDRDLVRGPVPASATHGREADRAHLQTATGAEDEMIDTRHGTEEMIGKGLPVTDETTDMVVDKTGHRPIGGRTATSTEEKTGETRGVMGAREMRDGETVMSGEEEAEEDGTIGLISMEIGDRSVLRSSVTIGGTETVTVRTRTLKRRRGDDLSQSSLVSTIPFTDLPLLIFS